MGHKKILGILWMAAILAGLFFYQQDVATAGSPPSPTINLSLFIPPEEPTIVSLIASDPNGEDAVYGNGDVITVTFDQTTNRPPTATKTDLENLFTFSQNLGEDFTGSWTSASVLKITIVNQAGATPPTIGGLTLTLKADGNLRNEAGNSFASTDTSPPLSGDFGNKAGPGITSLIAEDPNNDDAVYDVGDTITVRFSENTNGQTLFGSPAVLSKTNLDALFDYQQGGVPISLGANYQGQFTNLRTLVIEILATPPPGDPTPAIGQLTLAVKASAGLQNDDEDSLSSVAVSPPLGGTFGTAPGPFFLSLLAEDPDGGDAMYGTGDTITAIFSEPTNQPFGTTLSQTDLDNLFLFSQDLGSGHTGEWIDPVTLVITIGTPAAPPPTIGGLHLTVKSAGNLRDQAETSLPSTAISPLLSGNFGTRPGPSITSLVASDPNGGDAVFNNGDVITVTFNEATNRPPAATKANLDALFTFSQSLGTNYVGSWASQSVLKITIQNSAGGTASVGGLQLTVKASANLKNSIGTSLASTSASPLLTGSFGDKSGPSFTSLIASDPSNDDAIFDAGDRITARFNEDTNTPPVNSKTALDSLFTFSQEIGDDYSGSFTNPRTLVITILDATADTPPRVGQLQLTVKQSGNLKDADGTSLASTAVSPVLGGTFGTASGPSITSLVAADPDGGDAVFGAGDTITVRFASATNQQFGPTLTKLEVDDLFSFSQSLGSAYTGLWTDARTLVITVLTTGAPPLVDDDGVDDGELRLTVKSSAGLKNADGTSLASNAISPLLTGNFGTLAGPSIVSTEAIDPNGGDAVFNNDDIIKVTFSEATNRPLAATKSNLDALFTFSQSLGTNYVGSWNSPSVLEITIIDSSLASPPVVNQLTITAKPAGNLKNEQATSLASDSTSSVLTGSFGDKAGPGIASLEAADPSNDDAVFDTGDTLTIRFTEDTNQPFGPTLTRAELDSLFSFSQSIGDDYSGSYSNAKTLIVTIDDATTDSPPEVGQLQFTVLEDADLKDSAGTSLASTAVSPFLIGTFGTAKGPTIIDLIAQDPFGTDAVFGDDDTITLFFDVPTNQPFGPDLTETQVDSLLTFSQPLPSSDYTARWFDSQTLVITFDSAGTEVPTIGGFSAEVNEEAELKNEDETSLASISASPLLSGNFGTKPGPAIVSIVANDPKDPVGVGLDDGDTIKVSFDEATNQPPVATKADLDDLFSFSQSLGTDYSGVWFDPLTLIITIEDSTGGTATVGSLTLTVLDDDSNDLNNSANTSLDSTSVSPVLEGDYGQKAGPAILALIADDPKDTRVPGFDNGDTITVIFSEKTSLVNPFTRAELDDLFTFSQSIGDDYTGVLTEAGDLVITIIDGEQLTEPPIVGELQLIVKESGNIQADGGSLPSTAVSPFLSGNFGQFVEEISLCEGGDAFSTFPDGKTAEVSFAGTDDCGGFSFETADETTSGRIEFVGEPVRITPQGNTDCSVPPHCLLAFVFRESQIPLDDEGNPIDPFTDVKILKDVNDDEQILQDFDGDGDISQADLDSSNEVFNGLPLAGINIGGVVFDTPQTTVVALDDVRFEASANTPSNSKFAIGGIKALALGSLAPSVGAPSTPSTPSTSTAASPVGTASGGAGASGGPQQEGQAGVLAFTQVKLYEVSWDKCDENLIRIVAGPPGPGLSVKIFSSLAGLLPVTEVAEQPFKTATVYEAPVDEVETFIRVQVEGVLGREASLAQRSIDLKECTGQVGGFSEPEETITPTIGVPIASFPSGTPSIDGGSMFETSYNDIDFGVGYKLPEGEITSMNVNEQEKSVTFDFSNGMSGKVMLSLPRGMISADGNNYVLLNPATSEQIDYQVLESGSQYVTLEMALPEGTQSLTVIGTSVVPEFGSLVFVILVFAVILIISISRIKQIQIIKQ